MSTDLGRSVVGKQGNRLGSVVGDMANEANARAALAEFRSLSARLRQMREEYPELNAYIVDILSAHDPDLLTRCLDIYDHYREAVS